MGLQPCTLRHRPLAFHMSPHLLAHQMQCIRASAQCTASGSARVPRARRARPGLEYCKVAQLCVDAFATEAPDADIMTANIGVVVERWRSLQSEKEKAAILAQLDLLRARKVAAQVGIHGHPCA
jgi:hypothetical protein